MLGIFPLHRGSDTGGEQWLGTTSPRTARSSCEVARWCPTRIFTAGPRARFVRLLLSVRVPRSQSALIVRPTLCAKGEVEAELDGWDCRSPTMSTAATGCDRLKCRCQDRGGCEPKVHISLEWPGQDHVGGRGDRAHQEHRFAQRRHRAPAANGGSGALSNARSAAVTPCVFGAKVPGNDCQKRRRKFIPVFPNYNTVLDASDSSK